MEWRNLVRSSLILLFGLFLASTHFISTAHGALLDGACPVDLELKTPIDPVHPLDARASDMREQLERSGEAYVKANAKDGVLHVDMLAIGAGPMTAIIAANFRGSLLALESTPYAGTFDKGRDSFFINSPERSSRTGNPFPGSPITLKNVIAGPGVMKKVYHEDTHTTAGPLGNLTLETLNFANTPVLFNTTASPIEKSGDDLIVTTPRGLKIVAKMVVLGGEGDPRLALAQPQFLSILKADGITDDTPSIYKTDQSNGAAVRRVVTSDEVLDAADLSQVIKGKTILVSGEGHGGLSALIKILAHTRGEKIYWVGKNVPYSAMEDREIYYPVAEAVKAGKIIPLNGEVLATNAVTSSNSVYVSVYHMDGTVEKVTVDQNVVAVGYQSNTNSFFGASFLAARPGMDVVQAKLPPLTGIDVPNVTAVGPSISNVFLLGPRMVTEMGRLAGMFIPPQIMTGRIGTIIDLTARQAAALGEKLSTVARTIVPKREGNVDAEYSISKLPTPPVIIDAKITWEASLDVRKDVGQLLKGIQVDSEIKNLAVSFNREDRAVIVKTSSVDMPGLQTLVATQDFQNNLAILFDGGRTVTVSVPVVDGLPVLHAMTMETPTGLK